ncbi:MAG: hypothetical protein ABDH23_03500 [Endomicrobiia bacterium]
MLKFKKIFLVLNLLVTNIHSSDVNNNYNEIILKLQKLNYTSQQIQQILTYVESVKNNSLPYSIVINSINEAFLKKIPFEKFFPKFKNDVLNSLLAKQLIQKVTTKNFYPKEYEYSIILTSKILDSKVTEEEYTKFMILLSDNFTFEDALYMVNYYSVFKKCFPLEEIELEGKKIKNPSEILFLKYSNRSLKEMSLIVNHILKYFYISKQNKELFELLFKHSTLSTNKLIKKIRQLYDEKVKKEVKQEVQLDKIY